MPATLLIAGVLNAASNGPGPQPTGLLAKFRLRYPELAAVSDDRVGYWLNDAERTVTPDWGSDEESATLAYAAHRVARSTGATGTIPAGVTRFRSGSMDVSFTEAAANALSDGGYSSTPYGREFLIYLRRESRRREVGMLDAMFAGIATSMSQALGGPYHAAVVHSETDPVFDDGGSIATPGTPIARDCLCQVDAATQAMRQAEGFVDTDVRLLVLTASLSGTVIVGQRVEVQEGPGTGTYAVLSASRDPLGLCWDCRGRRA